MGSIISPPKPSIPQTQIRYVPASQPEPSISVDPETESPSEEDIAGEQRRENLLRRDRGRFGTVTSGFRGFLDNSGGDNQSKQLLGE